MAFSQLCRTRHLNLRKFRNSVFVPLKRIQYKLKVSNFFKVLYSHATIYFGPVRRDRLSHGCLFDTAARMCKCLRLSLRGPKASLRRAPPGPRLRAATRPAKTFPRLASCSQPSAFSQRSVDAVGGATPLSPCLRRDVSALCSVCSVGRRVNAVISERLVSQTFAKFFNITSIFSAVQMFGLRDDESDAILDDERGRSLRTRTLWDDLLEVFAVVVS